MIARMLTGSVMLALSMLLAGCGGKSAWEQPPNVTGSGVVDKITKDTRYSKAFGELSSTFLVHLTSPDPADMAYVYVSGRIEDDEMARSIGKQVSVKCYRETPKDYCYASGYGYDGRELIPPRK